MIKNIVIHHSCTDPNNKDIWAVSVDGHDYVPGFFIDGKEFRGNYHYHIYQDGEVKHPIPDNHYTYHAGNYDINLKSVAICFIGNFEENNPSIESLQTANSLVQELSKKYGELNIFLHRDLFNTACPGKNITIDKILEAKMGLTQQQVDRCYWAVLKRAPELNCPYIGSNMDIVDMWAEVADSQEHNELITHMVSKREYEKVTEDLYRRK